MSARIGQTVEVIEETIRLLLEQGFSPQHPPGSPEVSQARIDANHEVAKRRNIADETVISKYSTQMGKITTDVFDQDLWEFLVKGEPRLKERLLKYYVEENDRVKVAQLQSPFIESTRPQPPPPSPSDGVSDALALVLGELEAVLGNLEEHSRELLAQRDHHGAARILVRAAKVTEFQQQVQTLHSEWRDFCESD